ncbi:MAG: hypothetical protein GY869_23335 [Planctomycetes bacterium]|nr:hypothetical protein [Planctomycetota bacterium]
MADGSDSWESSLQEVRRAQQDAERMRDQPQAELNRRGEEGKTYVVAEPGRREEGEEARRKAVLAANRAVESMGQALKEMERVQD